MTLARIDDWTALPGIETDVRLAGTTVCTGKVDVVSDDGAILWILPNAGTRRLFEKADAYEAWAPIDSPGFHYRVAKGGPSSAL